MDTKPKVTAQLKLRLPVAVKDALSQSAKRNHRTMNAELLAILDQSKTQQPQGAQA